MNLFDYVPMMKDIGGKSADAGIIILSVFLVLIFFKMLAGKGRGTFRQLVRTGMTVGAAIVSFVAADGLSQGVIGSLDQNTVDGVKNYLATVSPESTELINDLLSVFSSDTIEHILLLPAAIVLVPLIFILVFVLLKSILTVVGAILCKVFKFKKPVKGSQKLLGALLAALEGIICFAVLLFPFTSAAKIAGQVYESAIVEDGEGADVTLMEQYTQNILPLSENPLVSFINSIGGEALASHFATVELDGEKSDLRNDVVPLLQLTLKGDSGEKINFKNLSERDKAIINRTLAAMEDSPYLSTLISEIVRSGVGVIQSGKFIELGEINSSITDALFDFLGSFSRENFAQDLNTVRDLYFLLSDSGILTSILDGEEDLMSALGDHHEDGNSTVSSLVEILQKNPRTAPLVKAITEMLLDTLTRIEIDGVPVVSYDQLKNDMEEVLSIDRESYQSDEDYKQALTTTLDNTLIDHGIVLEDEIVEDIADYVDEHFSEIEELTEAQFNSILLHYYEAYQSFINSGELPEDFIH